MEEQQKRWLQHYPSQVPKTLDYPDVPLTHFLVEAARDFPDRDAIFFLGKQITFRQLLDEVYCFAHALIRYGVKAGDRVGIMLPNSPQAVIAYYSALLVGGIVVQFNPMYTERELEYQLIDSGTSTLICLDLLYTKVHRVKESTSLERTIVTSIKDYLPFPKNWLYSMKLRLEGKRLQIPWSKEVLSFKTILQREEGSPLIPPYSSSDNLALLQYTGGTTGTPKAAMLTHGNLVSNCCQAEAWLYKVKRGQAKIMGVLPFFHVYGMTVVMNLSVKSAATMVLVPKYDRDEILSLITKCRPTYFPGAPTIYVGLINHPDIADYDLSSIEACISGSAPLPLDVQQKFEQLTGGLLVEGYGLTETSPVTHGNLIWDREKNATIGIPWPDTDAKIIDLETGELLSPGKSGELLVKGPQVMKGYWNRPEETQAVLDEEGWFSTGDIAMMEEDGYFYILDRKKDMIVAGGFNIYPREVEEVLYQHPAVEEAAVIGVPDSYRGETVKAFLVLKPGKSVTEEELDAHCRARLSNYKVPRFYEFRKELPKTTVYKVLRRVLLEEELRKREQIEQ